MKFIAQLAILLASSVYCIIALQLVQAMESDKVADFGYNPIDVYLFVFAMVLLASGMFGFLYVAIVGTKD